MESWDIEPMLFFTHNQVMRFKLSLANGSTSDVENHYRLLTPSRFKPQDSNPKGPGLELNLRRTFPEQACSADSVTLAPGTARDQKMPSPEANLSVPTFLPQLTSLRTFSCFPPRITD